MRGLFITVEGVEGCGKSTQVELLCSYLASRGETVAVTREPGGTPLAEAIRNLLLNPDHGALSPVAELLLYEGARAQHVDELILPSIRAGRTVVCDRFFDSTTAYQGGGRRLPTEMVLSMHAVAAREAWPDLTILIDLPAAVGLERLGRIQLHDRLEREPLAFHERVRERFLEIARDEPDRVKVVDGSGPVEEVAAAIRNLVDRLFVER